MLVWLAFAVMALIGLTIVVIAVLARRDREIAMALLATAVPVELVLLGTLVARLAGP